jgi:DHA2 family multidrug resistance protein-like MFS transporter
MMTDGLPNPQRAFAFLTLAIGVSMSVLDGSIVNVALPVIAKDLRITPADAIWIVNAYQLAITVSLLPLASLGDILGYRRVYWCGLAVFTASSFACAMSSSLAMLVAARMTQGLGAAGLMSVNIALVRFTYPRALLGRGVGNTALVVAVSSAAGPSVAAAILSVAPWQWLFLVNVPLGIVALFIAARTLPASPLSGHRLDSLSVALNALTFGLLITGIDKVGDRAQRWIGIAQLAAAAAIGFVFVRRQLRQKLPLLPVDLLRRPVFALSMATSVMSFAAQALAYVALPFYFEDVLMRSETATGLLMTPWPLATALMAPVAGRLADRYAPGRLASLGLLILGVGLALVAMLPDRPASADIVWRLAWCGFGFGLFQSPNNKTIIASAPRERSGGASGLQSTGRLVGQSTGAALMAVIFSTVAVHHTQVALWLAACFTVGGACASYLRKVDM